jgi:RecB family exonuclease
LVFSREILYEFEPTSCLVELVVSHFEERLHRQMSGQTAGKVDDLVQVRDKCLYVLPTQRLCRLVARQIWTKSKKISSPIPHLLTWDQWKQEIAPFALYASKRPWMIPLTLSESTPFLKSILKSDQSYSNVFHPDQAHELLYLWTLLIQSNRDHDWIPCLEEKLRLRWTLPEESLQTLLTNWNHVHRICAELEMILGQSNFVLSARLQQLWMKAESSVVEDYLKILPFNRVVIAGLTNVTTLELNWLKTVTTLIIDDAREPTDKVLLPQIEYLLPMAWHDLPRSSPLRSFTSHLVSLTDEKGTGDKGTNRKGKSTLKESHWSLKSLSMTHDLTIYKCKDPWSECLTAVRIAVSMNEKHQIPLHEIQIIVPNEAVYANYLHAALQWNNVKTSNVSLPSIWGMSNRIVALYKTIMFLRNPTLEQLSHMLSSKLDGQEVEFDKLLNIILQTKSQTNPFSHQKGTQQFDFGFLKNPSFESIYRRVYSAKLTSSVDYLKTLSNVFEDSRFDKISRQLVELQDIVTVFKDFTHQQVISVLMDSYFGQESSISAKAIDDEMLQIRTWLDRFTKIQETLKGFTVTADEFLDQFLEYLMTIQSRVVGEPMSGLQVIGLTEARFVPASLTIILGMNEGSFPASVPRDKILDDSMKSILGLPNWQDLESLEETTFGLLAARLKQLHLLYSEETSDGPQVPSRWIESFIYSGAKVRSDSELNVSGKLDSTTTSLDSRKESLPCDNAMSSYVDSLTQMPSISATDIKRLLACPFQFFMGKIGAQTTETWEDEDPRTIGIYLHKSIELAISDWQSHFPKVMPEDSWTALLTKKLMSILPKNLTSAPEILDYVHLGLPALAHWLSKNISEESVVHSELEFGRSSLVHLPAQFKHQPIALSGTMDLVLQNKDSVHILDFKLGDAPSVADVLKLRDPQLLVYVLAVLLLHPQLSIQHSNELVMVSYMSLTKGTFSKPLSASSVQTEEATTAFRNNHLGFESSSNLAKSLHKLLCEVQRSFQTIEATRQFKLNTEACDYCSFAAVCRKEDPLVMSRGQSL